MKKFKQNTKKRKRASALRKKAPRIGDATMKLVIALKIAKGIYDIEFMRRRLL